MSNQYKLRVFSKDAGFSEIRISALSETDARQQAEKQGWAVVEMAPIRIALWQFKPGFSVTGFARELLILLRAGMTIAEAVEVLAHKAHDGVSRQVLAELNKSLQQGLAFSAAMEGMPQHFPVLFVASVRSSERTGHLPDAIQRFLDYQIQVNQVRNKLISASIYPIVLLGVSATLMLFLLSFVMPRFSRIYGDLGDRMPWASRMMLQWSQLMEAHGGLVLWGFAGALVTMGFLLSRASVRVMVMRAIWRIPALGERMRLYQLARFTRTMAMLLSGGISFVPALGMTAELLRQPSLRASLDAARKLISEGRAVSEVFAQTGLATEVGVRLLIVGERSGELPRMLAQVADLYDQTLERELEWFGKLLEPALMIVVGLVIGVVILLMYLPIFELANLAR